VFDGLFPSVRRSNFLAIGFLFALALIFFFPVLQGGTFSTIGGRQFSIHPWRAFDPVFPDYPQNDQADLSYPWQIFLTESLRSGTLPLWNPYSFAGQPFFANGSSAVLYPPKLLAAAVLSPGWAHDTLSILHVLLAGIGMWLFLRELGFDLAAALLGGVAWMLCPFSMAWLQLEVVAPSAAWLPIGCWLTHRAVARNSWRWTIGAAAALALALISGHLLFMVLIQGVVVAYGTVLIVVRFYRHRAEARASHVARLIILIVGPWMLAAAVLLPTVVFLRSLERLPLPYDRAHETIRLPYKVFAHLLLPPPASPVTELEMHQMAYVGRLVAILALIGVFSRLRGVWFGCALVIGTFLVATDTVVLKWIYAVFPQFSFFSPLGRLLNFFDFGVIILGAAGLETVLQWLPNRQARAVAIVLVVGLTSAELVVYARRVNPEFPPREERFSFPRTPLIRRLGPELRAGHNGPGRLIPVRRSPNEFSPPILSANEATVYGFESVAGWDSTLPNRAETLWKIVAGEPVDAVLAETYRRAFWASFDVAGTRFDLLPRLGVTTIVTAPEVADDPLWIQKRDSSGLRLQAIYSGIDGHIYRILGVDGGPVVVHHPTFVGDGRDALDSILNPDFDYRQRAVFETDGVPSTWRAHGTAYGDGSARVVSKAANNEVIEVSSTNDGWVVVPTNWDAGWSADVDGEPAPVVRANYTFQAVPVRAGRTRVRLTYEPAGLRLGLGISLTAWTVAIVGFVRRSRIKATVLVPCLVLALLTAACRSRYAPPADSSIHIMLGTYGDNCGGRSGNATASVARRCEGNLNCEYPVDASQLDDPAPGCPKNFIINYRCFDGARDRRVVVDADASGSVASLTCE
jgi:hypothetical protein